MQRTLEPAEAAEDTESHILSARQEPGLVLVSLRSPGRILKLNAAAREILSRAHRRALMDRVRALLSQASPAPAARRPPLAWTFRSGRRTYALRGLWLAGRTEERTVLALLLERINRSRLSIERCARLYRLSSREVDVITALAQGHTDKAIAEALGLRAETVRGHLKSIRMKLGVSTRTAILHKLSELGNR